MKRPAVFFDRDNTLIRNDGYLGNPADVVLIDGAADAVAKVRALGFVTIIFSNQSGVARGMFTEDTVRAVNARMDEILLENNPSAVIDGHEFCPFHPDATVEEYRQESERRKPKPGMILETAERLALDLSRSWVIGDAPRDIEAGKAAGCRTILFHDPNLPPSEAARQAAIIEPDFVVSSLRRAVQIIAREAGLPDPDAPAESPDAQATSEPQHEEQAPVEPEPEPESQSAESTTSTRTSRWNRLIANTPSRSATAHAPATSAPPAPIEQRIELNTGRLESQLQQILDELRRQREAPQSDFSVSKLMAGVVQVLAIGALFFSYFHQGSSADSILLLAIFLEALTIALLIMGQQK